MQTTEAIGLFLSSRAAKGLPATTIRWYRGILFCFACQFPALPEQPTEVEQFLVSCHVGDERRHGYFRALRAFYRFLKKRYGITNPVELVEPPRRSVKQPFFLSAEQLNRLLAFPHPKRIKAALLFLIDTGARLDELATLTVEMLEETSWGFTARVNGKTGMRLVPISYETYHALMVVLPFPYKSHRLGELISRGFKNAGIPGSAITLRHTFGTLWQGDELVLQRIMGHTHFETTIRYRHLRSQVLSQQHQQFSPLRMVLSSSRSML